MDGSEKSQEPISLPQTEIREEKYVVLVLGWFLKKFLKARNYVEVEACARVEA